MKKHQLIFLFFVQTVCFICTNYPDFLYKLYSVLYKKSELVLIFPNEDFLLFVISLPDGQQALLQPKNNKKYVSNINISQKICIFA